jgi:hypothetical protein
MQIYAPHVAFKAFRRSDKVPNSPSYAKSDFTSFSKACKSQSVEASRCLDENRETESFCNTVAKSTARANSKYILAAKSLS